MPFAVGRNAQGVVLGLGLLLTTVGLLLLANADADKCAQGALAARVGCFLFEYKELVSGLLALDGALFAAWLAWIAVQQQMQSFDLQKKATLEDQSIALQGEIDELNAMVDWAQSTFRRLDITVPGGNAVITGGKGATITADDTRRGVIFLDNIGAFALRTNQMGVGAAFNACFASFHQLADNFRKPDLSAEEMDELFTASRGNVGRLDIWLKQIQELIEQKQQRAKTLTKQIESLKQKWGEN